MGVPGEVSEHGFWPGEGRLGVDERVLPLEWRETREESIVVAQILDLAKERELAYHVSIVEPGQKKPPEQARQHTHR